MKLFQRILRRSFCFYKKVNEGKSYKIVKEPCHLSAPASKLIDAKILAGGPITVADFMKLVLTNPLTGYYMKRDVFGEKGDFITSPEISQMFGEMIGIWIYHEMHKIGVPKSWQLVELGPGRGTLTKDILNVLKRLKLLNGMSLHMVEVSPYLASLQAQILCDDVIGIGLISQENHQTDAFYKSSKTIQGVPVFWYPKIENIPRSFSVIIAHEFFDALPIHKYQRVDNGWREVLINSSRDDGSKLKFEYTLSKNETPMSKLLIREDEKRDHLEISFDAGFIAKYIADLLCEEGGFSLIIDYGHDGVKTDTFRAFKDHKLHNPLEEPGSADLTADVDFAFLREVMKDKMLVYGPVEQGDFLVRMGIKTRLNLLLEKLSNESNKGQLKSGYKMLVDKSQMGERYKVLAAFPQVLRDHLNKYPVAGFLETDNAMLYENYMTQKKVYDFTA